MTNQLQHIQPFVYTNPQGLRLEVLFVLDPEKQGYINATAIAKQFGKEPYDWLKYQNVQDYIQALLENMNQSQTDKYRFGTKTITYNDLVIIVQGGTPGRNGTWLHPKLAVIFARWISPHFAVWCDEQITELLRQNSAQQQFPELSQIFDKLEGQNQQFISHIDKRFYAVEKRLYDMDKYIHDMEQRFDERFAINEKVLSRFHEQSVEDTKHTLGQIYNGINQLKKTVSVQLQSDFLKPPLPETVKKVLLDYQQALEQILHSYQDELIQGYLIGIKENLAQITQRLPEPVVVQQIAIQPSTVARAETSLAAEITALRAAGQSWHGIAQQLNERSVATASGKGKWYGNSVKRYVALH